MNLLEDITSGDPHRIWSASSSIRRLRDKEVLSLLVQHLDEIKEKTRGIELGGMLRPNSSHLNFALRKLEFIRDQHQCLCRLYTEDDLFDPKQEETAGNIRILNETIVNHSSIYTCQCLLCNTRYHVEERQYHYPWWLWQKID